MKTKPIVFFRVYCLHPWKYERKLRVIAKDLYHYVVQRSFDVHGVKTAKEAIERVRPHLKGLISDETITKVMRAWKAEATKRNLTYAKRLTPSRFWQFACDKMSSPDGVI